MGVEAIGQKNDESQTLLCGVSGFFRGIVIFLKSKEHPAGLSILFRPAGFVAAAAYFPYFSSQYIHR